MVRITRVYTKTGDDGTTSLGDLSRTAKTDPRLAAYADVNEANAALGLALTVGGLNPETTALLTRVQNDLFDVGADLSTPLRTDPPHPELRVRADWIEELERECDAAVAVLPPLTSFILPGGSPASAHLHHACTVVRRAERSTWAAIEAYGSEPAADRGVGGVNVLAAQYLNRLSDLLFLLARAANDGGRADVLWVPGGGREAAPNRE